MKEVAKLNSQVKSFLGHGAPCSAGRSLSPCRPMFQCAMYSHATSPSPTAIQGFTPILRIAIGGVVCQLNMYKSLSLRYLHVMKPGKPHKGTSPHAPHPICVCFGVCFCVLVCLASPACQLFVPSTPPRHGTKQASVVPCLT